MYHSSKPEGSVSWFPALTGPSAAHSSSTVGPLSQRFISLIIQSLQHEQTFHRVLASSVSLLAAEVKSADPVDPVDPAPLCVITADPITVVSERRLCGCCDSSVVVGEVRPSEGGLAHIRSCWVCGCRLTLLSAAGAAAAAATCGATAAAYGSCLTGPFRTGKLTAHIFSGTGTPPPSPISVKVC